jgi:hypothetical protein
MLIVALTYRYKVSALSALLGLGRSSHVHYRDRITMEDKYLPVRHSIWSSEKVVRRLMKL